MTAPSFSLDTSCVLNLLNPDEAIDDDLIMLLRFGLMGDAQLCVTETCPAELAETAAATGRRSEIAKRAAILPVLATPPQRLVERDTLAASFFKAMWPNSPGKGKTADHSRRDCEHLAAHVLGGGTAFVTRDEKLRGKVTKAKPHSSLVVLSPTDAVARATAARPKRMVFATQSFGVREATKTDSAALSELLHAPLSGGYPDFDAWLAKTLDDASTVVNLGVINRSDIGGVAIWKPKDARTAKLSTLYLRPDARNLGLGQHMLFHCLRQWVEKRIERAYVTVSAQHEDVLALCVNFGFRIEGSAQRRYATGESELVLTKHLAYSSVSDAALGPWLDELGRTVFSVHPTSASASPDYWFVRPASVRSNISWNATEEVVEIDDGGAVQTLGLQQIEELFYPVRVALKDRHAYVIPIQPQWAEQMMEIPRPQEPLFRVVDRLRLRIENAYYCSPVYATDHIDGAPIIFYVSKPDSALTGIARMLSRVIAEPEDLFLRFGELGAYQLSDIKKHVAKRGPHKKCAMAMRFGWWVPFPKPIALQQAVDAGLLPAHPQRMFRVTYATFEAMMRAGGLDW